MNFNAFWTKMVLPLYTRPRHLEKFGRLLLLPVIIVALSASKSQAQESVDLNLNMKNKALTIIFNDIAKQTKYLFFYKETDIEKYSATVSLKNATIDQALKASLKNLPLAYNVRGNYVLVRYEPDPAYNKLNDTLKSDTDKSQPVTPVAVSTIAGMGR